MSSKKLGFWAVVLAFPVLAACSSGSPGEHSVANTAEAVTVPAPGSCDTADCCPAGFTQITYTTGDDTRTNFDPNRCIIALDGRDTIQSYSDGDTVVLAGPGDDTVFVGNGKNILRGGDGRDTLFGGGSSDTIYGNAGDDTIFAGNGNNFIVPGPGIDTVASGTGNDTFAIYDLCEVGPGETLDAGTGDDTLITPVPLADLLKLGVKVQNFEHIVVQQNSCKSECVAKPNCNGHGTCAEGPTPGAVTCQCDAGTLPPDCHPACDPGSVKAVPGQCGCQVLDTDSDGDKVPDCLDACPNDPTKTEPLLCGCNQPESDLDGDGIPTCVDPCEKDGNNGSIGQCGCVGQSTLQPAGTACTDSVCRVPGTTTTCNGSGVCGNPQACSPEPTAGTCFVRRFEGKIYWFCPGPVTWTQAATRCQALTGRHLVRIDDQRENAFVSEVMKASSWLGAAHGPKAGDFTWSTAAGNDGSLFYSSGSATNGLYDHWAPGAPTSGGDCVDMHFDAPRGQWSAGTCTQTFGYVCEQDESFGNPTPPNLDCGNFFPDRFCTQPKTVPCVPVAATLPPTQAEAFAQIEACNKAFEDGTCTQANALTCAACKGAATPPAAGSSCVDFSDEEKGFCKLGELLTSGCVDGQDCCSIAKTFPANTSFDASAEGFTYADDTFRATNAPNYAAGQLVTTGGHPNGALRVSLGGIDNTAIHGMSGGWRLSFNLTAEALVGVSFDYNLTQSPNYEADELSQVLVSVDGKLRGTVTGTGDTVAQVAGDGDNGPNITTGWTAFQVNVGTLAAGAHTLIIGGYNSQKTNLNESTDLLIDNVKIEQRTDNCPGGYECGPVYPDNCNACDEKTNGFCSKQCPGVLRCGKPFSTSNPSRSCANSSVFSGSCNQTEICPAPEAQGKSDPTAGPGADLTPSTFNPDSVFGTPAASKPVYPDDPPCTGTTCALGQQHLWCKYDVSNPLPDKPVPLDTKQGDNGSGPVVFHFDPSVGMNFSAAPLPFGLANYKLDASAAFAANVKFSLDQDYGPVSIIDALLALHADVCQAKTSDSHILIFDKDFLPDSVKFDSADLTSGFVSPGDCQKVIATYVKAVDRAKKAYRDALELLRQYNQHKTDGTSLPADLCAQLLKDPPQNFPSQACNSETPAATINRFVDFYRAEAGRLIAAQEAYAESVLHFHKTLVLPPDTDRSEETIAQAFFPLGPIPLTLQVEAFSEYGLGGQLDFTLDGGAFLKQGTGGDLAFVDAHATPYALAGASMFVGVGFGVNGFDVSAGVEGALTLGRISLDNSAGAGISVQPQVDKRDFPADVTAAAPSPAKDTIFPVGGPKEYAFSLRYRYGSSVVLSEILKGTISARVRIKFFFFSKTWRRTLLQFNGFGPVTIPLISGSGGTGSSAADGSHAWGTAQMPLPFADIKKLPANEVLPGVSAPLDTSRVEQLFYDSLCQCSKITEPCFRNGDCCDKTEVCFSDPLKGGAKACSNCRAPDDSCNVDSDCCSGNTCFHDPSNGKQYCSPCRGKSQSCNGPSECCAKDGLTQCTSYPGQAPQNTCNACLPTGAQCFQGQNQCCPGMRFGCIVQINETVAECSNCLNLNSNCLSPDDCCNKNCVFQIGASVGTCEDVPR